MSASIAAALLLASFHTVQIHAVGDETSALESVASIRAHGFDAYYLLESDEQGELQFKVRVGSFEDRAAARSAGKTIKEQAELADFFVTTTKEEEIVVLANAMGPLVEDKALGSGILRDGPRPERLKAHIHNYLTVFLLLTGEPGPGRKLAQAGLWDTNMGDRRELQVVTRARKGVPARAFVLYWQDRHFQVARVARGTHIALYDFWDLVPGPLRFLVFQTTRGGDQYREESYVVVRWNTDLETYEVVGEVLGELRDAGEASLPASAYSAKIGLEDVDDDREQEILAAHAGAPAETLDFYDWNGQRLQRATDASAFLQAWKEREHLPRSKVAATILGMGRRLAMAGKSEAAIRAWRLLIVQMPDTPQAPVAREAIQDLEERRNEARLRVDAGVQLLEAGSLKAAAAELRRALQAYPDYGPALYNSARVSAEQGDLYHTVTYLRRAFEIEPKTYRAKATEEAAFADFRNRSEYQALLEARNRE